LANLRGKIARSRKIYQCHKCHHQTSLTAGNLFHGTKLALTQWFLAIFLLTQRKQSLSALQLSRDLGVNYDTVWRMKHKLMQVMLERGRQDTLGDRIEIDDAYLGGEMPGRRGRGAYTRPLSSPPLRRRTTAGRSNCICVVSVVSGSGRSRAMPAPAFCRARSSSPMVWPALPLSRRQAASMCRS
jgi:hypothetical protein